MNESFPFLTQKAFSPARAQQPAAMFVYFVVTNTGHFLGGVATSYHAPMECS